MQVCQPVFTKKSQTDSQKKLKKTDLVTKKPKKKPDLVTKKNKKARPSHKNSRSTHKKSEQNRLSHKILKTPDLNTGKKTHLKTHIA